MFDFLSFFCSVNDPLVMVIKHLYIHFTNNACNYVIVFAFVVYVYLLSMFRIISLRKRDT